MNTPLMLIVYITKDQWDFSKGVIKNIASSPNLYPIITNNIRRCLLHRFPFSIFYSVVENKVVILSIAHQHRKPNHWEEI